MSFFVDVFVDRFRALGALVIAVDDVGVFAGVEVSSISGVEFLVEGDESMEMRYTVGVFFLTD